MQSHCIDSTYCFQIAYDWLKSHAGNHYLWTWPTYQRAHESIMEGWEAEREKLKHGPFSTNYHFITQWHVWEFLIPAEMIVWLEFTYWGVFPLNCCYLPVSYVVAEEDPGRTLSCDDIDALEARDRLVLPTKEESWEYLLIDPEKESKRFKKLLAENDLQAVIPSPVLKEWVIGLTLVRCLENGKVEFIKKELN